MDLDFMMKCVTTGWGVGFLLVVGLSTLSYFVIVIKKVLKS